MPSLRQIIEKSHEMHIPVIIDGEMCAFLIAYAKWIEQQEREHISAICRDVANISGYDSNWRIGYAQACRDIADHIEKRDT